MKSQKRTNHAIEIKKKIEIEFTRIEIIKNYYVIK